VLPLVLGRFQSALATATAMHQLPTSISALALCVRPLLLAGWHTKEESTQQVRAVWCYTSSVATGHHCYVMFMTLLFVNCCPIVLTYCVTSYCRLMCHACVTVYLLTACDLRFALFLSAPPLLAGCVPCFF
jgi:hypothetical protein